jgi:ADP-ribose pyrophosphatase YjhB (NUDIX family)
MNTILTLTDQDFVPDAPAGDRDSYWHRYAARAVVTDDDGAVAIMHAKVNGYYKLPGGGIDEGEEVLDALHREIREEVGVKIRVTGEIGIVEEHRDFIPMNQTSYAYLATVDGKKGQPDYTEEELAAGFEIVWAQDIDAAIALIDISTDPHDVRGNVFMQRRDLVILQTAKKLLATV